VIVPRSLECVCGSIVEELDGRRYRIYRPDLPHTCHRWDAGRLREHPLPRPPEPVSQQLMDALKESE